jgi:hypothetical protein
MVRLSYCILIHAQGGIGYSHLWSVSGVVILDMGGEAKRYLRMR